ncbi:MAG: ABC transporter ATP-binding protein [Candidatus Limnocylindrales bacterium]
MTVESRDPITAAALTAHSVFKRYRRGGWALRDVSLEIAAGSITALVGPNGAGKTTLIRIWVGFERTTRGSAQVLGADPWRERQRTTAHVGYIPQHPTLYDGLSVAGHIDLASYLRQGFDRDASLARLHTLGIDPNARAGELSGGQRAQVGLVLALGTNADVFLLDEPLASLDPLARRDFLTVLVATVRELHATTILSSHALSDIEAICDRLILLDGGRVRFDSSVTQALEEHSVADESTDLVHADGAIGSFADLRGRRSVLLRGPIQQRSVPGVRAATLEEVVMGYLARERK